MKTTKYSRQRELIISNLKGRKDHPTAEQLFESLKAQSVSLPTVYRNLSLLCESGEALRLRTHGGPDRFDADVSAHTHFECRNCGAFIDVLPPFCPDFQCVGTNIASVDSYSLTLFGLCTNCGKLQNKPSD